MLSHSSLTIPSLHCTVGLYLCVRFFLCSQNKFVSRPEPLRCRAVLFIRGDIMLLFLVRSCSLVLHSAGLGFSPPGFMVCSRQSVRSTMSAASHTKNEHTYKHTHTESRVSLQKSSLHCRCQVHSNTHTHRTPQPSLRKIISADYYCSYSWLGIYTGP